jgi:translation initiation factor IF-1
VTADPAAQTASATTRNRDNAAANEENGMPKEEMLEFDGTITEVLPDGNYRVKLDNEHMILAYLAGKMKKNRIRTLAGDRVIVEMSPYDLDRGRISFRHRTGPAIAPGQRRQNFRRR